MDAHAVGYDLKVAPTDKVESRIDHDIGCEWWIVPPYLSQMVGKVI
jgi:hypothetical protein